MKTIIKRFSAAFAALAVLTAAVAFDLSAKTASAAVCEVTHTEDNAWDGALPLGAGNYYLNSSVMLSEQIEITGAVTLCLNGQTITAASGSRAFRIKEGGSLTICDCQNGGKIYGGNVSSVTDGNSDSYGGAIIIDKGGSLTLNGGEITTCSAQRGGGVCVNGGEFTMNGGAISENTAAHQGGGVFVSGEGTFTMSGGTISGNTVTRNGDTDGGGGVYTSGKFTIKGSGEISGNSARDSFGGGVLVSGKNAEFTLESGTISENRAKYGGGVHISSSGTVTMKGGTIGSGNTANGGGGVSVGGGDFKMENGTITGNTGSGAGVYLSSGTFTMTNGRITQNTSSQGGGINMGGGTLTLNGPVTIANNPSGRTGNPESNIYLQATSSGAKTCHTITIGASFNPTATIGVHIQPKIECQEDVATTQFAAGVSAKDISGHFKNDDAGQEIVYADNKIKLHVEHDWSAWTITKVPTIDTAGTAKRVCKLNSSHTETVPLPALSDTDFWTKVPDKEDEYINDTYGTVTPSTQATPTTPPANNNNNNNNHYDDDDDDDDYYTPPPEPASSESETIIYNNPPTGISLAPSALAIAAITALLIRGFAKRSN